MSRILKNEKKLSRRRKLEMDEMGDPHGETSPQKVRKLPELDCV